MLVLVVVDSVSVFEEEEEEEEEVDYSSVSKSDVCDVYFRRTRGLEAFERVDIDAEGYQQQMRKWAKHCTVGTAVPEV